MFGMSPGKNCYLLAAPVHPSSKRSRLSKIAGQQKEESHEISLIGRAKQRENFTGECGGGNGVRAVIHANPAAPDRRSPHTTAALPLKRKSPRSSVEASRRLANLVAELVQVYAIGKDICGPRSQE